MRFKKYICIIVSLSMLLMVNGCSENKEGVKGEKKDKEVVVATSVAVTEILDKLGVEISGVPTTIYELPESTKNATKVGNPMNPDLEIIKSLKPTVVVLVDTLGEDYKNIFEENNIPSQFVTLTSIDGLKDAIKKIGGRFNKEEKVNEILNELESKESELKKDEKDKKKVMIVFAAPGSMMIATPKSYVGNLLNIVGGENVVKDEKLPFVNYNKEEITTLSPDMVLVMTHGNPEESKKMASEEFKTDVAWKNINAIKENKIVFLENQYFGMSANLKVIDALNKLDKILYDGGE